MSVIFGEALKAVRNFEFPLMCERDLVVALGAGRGALEAIYPFALASGLPREVMLRRAVAVFFGQCAGNVCDDLADGDCTYFEPGVPTAPMVQFILQHLMFEEGLRADVRPAAMTRVSTTLARAASFGPVELRTNAWSVPVYRQMAERTGGDQWQAYLQLLWDGTALSPHALELGAHVGFSSYVAMDLRDRDRRLFSLTSIEQWQVIEAASRSCAHLEAFGFDWLAPLLRGVRGALDTWGGA
jgi:hypothetical protein